MSYHFVRVAGETGHNNPSETNGYVLHEPPTFPKKAFNYYDYCLNNELIRIGWPGIGDLKAGNKFGSLDTLYSLETVKPHIKNYLLDFSHIPLGSVILMPNKAIPGNIYMGVVNKPYWYFHDVPHAPYECAHRLGVTWDKNPDGKPVIYHANKLGINIVGGWWLKAFYTITDSVITETIDKARCQH